MARRLVIRGRVQGVGFRYFFERTARRLGITGWVRNRADGSVEAVVDGTADAVEEITAWARHGPDGARVDNLELSNVPDENFDGFEIQPNG